jgi:hypothetical protein
MWSIRYDKDHIESISVQSCCFLIIDCTDGTVSDVRRVRAFLWTRGRFEGVSSAAWNGGKLTWLGFSAHTANLPRSI